MTQLAIITGYLALLLVLGAVSSRLSRGTSADYLLASHSIGPFLLLMSLFGTTMTAFALVGSTGASYRMGIGVYGMMASSSGIVHSLCFFLIGIKIWSFGQRFGYTTQIQFFRDRLESDKIGLLLFPILVGLIIPYLLIGVLAGGTVINSVTMGAFDNAFAEANHGIPAWLGSLLICVVVLMYVFMGGMRGTAWANTFQTLVFMVLGLVAFFVIAGRIGGQDGFFANLQAATEMVQQRHPEKLTRQNINPLEFATYMLIPLSAGMFPHLFQHWLTARSAQTFKLPVVVHPLFILIVWFPCVLIGVWATSATVGGAGVGELVIAEGTHPNSVLPMLVQKLSGDLLSGLLSAGILAAIMSSLDSQFLCIGTMFTTDVVLHYAGKNRFSDAQTVVLARGFIVAVVAVTYVLSLLNPVGVFTLGVWCFSGFASLVPLVTAALYWRGLTKAGAYASVLATAGTWLYLFVQADYAGNPGYQFLGMMPVATMFVCSTVALVVVSLVSRPPSDATLDRFFPRKSTAA